MGIARPNSSQAVATNECAAKCDQGDGSAEATQKYSDCVQSCIASLFPSSQTGALVPGAPASSGAAAGTGASSASSAASTGTLHVSISLTSTLTLAKALLALAHLSARLALVALRLLAQLAPSLLTLVVLDSLVSWQFSRFKNRFEGIELKIASPSIRSKDGNQAGAWICTFRQCVMRCYGGTVEGSSMGCVGCDPN